MLRVRLDVGGKGVGELRIVRINDKSEVGYYTASVHDAIGATVEVVQPIEHIRSHGAWGLVVKSLEALVAARGKRGNGYRGLRGDGWKPT